MEQIRAGLAAKDLAMLMVTKELADLGPKKDLLDERFKQLFDSATSFSNEYHIKSVYINDLQKKAAGKETLVLNEKSYNVLALAKKVEKKALALFCKARNAMLALQFGTVNNTPFQEAWKIINPRRFGVASPRFVIP